MEDLNEKLSRLASGQPSDWMEQAKYRRENRVWLRRSAAIAIRILDALQAQNLTQKELAERLNVSPQQVNKIVQGHENLTLETISNLEVVLGIQIIAETTNSKRSPKKKKPAA